MEPGSTPEEPEALPEEQLEELQELPEEPKPKRGPGRPRKTQELEPQPEEPKPKRGPGRPRKTQELEPQPEESQLKRGPGRPRKEPPEEPKRGPGRPRKTELPAQERGPRPRKELKELKTEEKTSERSWEQLDPIAELTRLIKQRNEEQARQRKTAYATMLGL